VPELRPGPHPQNRGEWRFLQRITLGQEIVDVMEIDAASNRGIEEIASCAKMSPTLRPHSRYKVYIIDEAHQITMTL